MNVFRELEEGTSVCPPTPQKLYFLGKSVFLPFKANKQSLSTLAGQQVFPLFLHPSKYTLLDNVGTVFPKASGFPVKGA